jgi:4-amino-4-deoxy-L-arabinose transferase-like glycosyltransferase
VVSRPAGLSDSSVTVEPTAGGGDISADGAGLDARKERGARPGLSPLWAALAIALLLVVYLGRLGGYPFQDPDEGRYAEIPREMIESGDWLTPRLNYVKYYEKPPLLYWLVAASFTLFGAVEWAGRLVSALAGLATIGMTFALGRSAFGVRAAWLGIGVLATAPLFFGLAQALVIDMLLTACTTATMVAFWFAHRAADRAVKNRWIVAVAVSAALGVLSKGLVALVLPGMVALAMLVLWRDWPTLRALVGWRPIVAFVAIAAPWFVLVSRVHPEFAYFIFVREHFERFAATVGHPEGPFYYFPVMLVGPLPWSAWALLLIFSRSARRAFGRIPAEPRTFLLVWAGFMFAFFTVASSKLATYVLPILPALALLMGAWIDELLDRESEIVSRFVTVTGRVVGAIGAAFVVAAVIVWPLADWFSTQFHVPADYLVYGARAVLATGLVLLATAITLRRGEIMGGRPVVRTAALVAGAGFALLASIEAREVVKTARGLALAFVEHRREGDLLVSYRHLMQSLSFYSASRVVQVEAENEIEHGAEYASDATEWFWDDTERLKREWSSQRRVFLATSRRKLPGLDGALDPPPRLLAQDHERLLLVNFPAPGSQPLPPSIAHW